MTVKVEPLPGVDVTLIEPWCSSIIFFDQYNPRPLPPTSTERSLSTRENFWNNWLRFSSSMPTPSSLMAILTLAARLDNVTEIFLPLWVYLLALSIRFSSTMRNFALSAEITMLGTLCSRLTCCFCLANCVACSSKTDCVNGTKSVGASSSTPPTLK